jgi:CO dehydrogenase/acetyl-CoA synthase gamma subunit (corrinoid Fe-S protein)
MLLADTYEERIDFLKYLPLTDCGRCGADTCEAFVQELRRGEKGPEDCPLIPENYYYPFRVALDADRIMPKFSCVTDPRPGPTGLLEVNDPNAENPLLVSGNHVHTQDVMMAILSTTRSPLFLLFTETRGNTVDMAMVYHTMTAEQIREDLRNSPAFEKTSHQRIIIPGLAAALAPDLRKWAGRNVVVGPVCAGELPLFMAPHWLPPDGEASSSSAL